MRIIQEDLFDIQNNRCSDAFFQEERQMLEEKRHKIRMIQQRKLSEQELATSNDLKDLPNVIPMPLSIGNRVYAHITTPEEGVFLGTIAAVDPCDHTYRVVFDRASLGSQTLADFEVKSLQPPIQAIPLRAYVQTYRPKLTPNPTGLTPNASIPVSLSSKINSAKKLYYFYLSFFKTGQYLFYFNIFETFYCLSR